MAKKRVLFLCTGNSCRSQMAEGLLRARASDRFEVFSAGTMPCFVHPTAIEVMAELGIDISGQRSKSVLAFAGQSFDYVISLCDDAARSCPAFPRSCVRLHWPFQDPVRATGARDEVRAAFARVRDRIAGQIDQWLTEHDTR